MKQVPFNGRILVLGCGGVARCTLPLLLRHLDMPGDRITVVDMVDHRDRIGPALAAGVQYVCEEITQREYRRQLARFAGPGDMIIDLAWNIGCADLLDWCHSHNVRYVNTSVELWDPYSGTEQQATTSLTLYARQMEIRRLIAGWKNGGAGPTAILEHGANPGLVSHFTKRGLIDIGRRVVTENPRDRRAKAIEEALAAGAFNRLAQLVGLKVLHISERDTQVTNRPKEPHEFVNTWSVEGFFEESIAPTEMGWGTHERDLPEDASLHASGPRNQICLDRFGMETFVRSRVPSREIVGMVIRHGEAFSISEALTVHDGEGNAAYRPTVHYAYEPCDAARESLVELRARRYEIQPSWRIMSDDITDGADELGCLLMGHDFKSWWTGTVLDIHEARRLVPGQNATTLQVAASVLAAVQWMIHNPRRGVLLPDQLPHEEILAVARPYLGEVLSQPIDWMPGNGRSTTNGARGKVSAAADASEAWQFSRFLTRRSPQRTSRRGSRRRTAERAVPFEGSARPTKPVAAGFHDRANADMLVDSPQ